MNQLEVRAAMAADQDTLFRAHEELFRGHIEQIWGWNDEWQTDRFRREWPEVDTVTVYVAGELAGYLQSKVEPDHLNLLNLGLYPRYQNRGIGAELIEWLKRRHTTIRLGVFRTNERALSFYLRNGFRITEKTETGFRLQWESHQPEQGLTK